MAASNPSAAAPQPGAGKADAIGYVFDIIVTRLDITHKDLKKAAELDSSSVVVQATFIKEQMKITSSRINVVEFKSGRSFEFFENPSTLRDDLCKNKLKLKVMVGTAEVGQSMMEWPESFVNCLLEPKCGTELTHVFVSEVKGGDRTNGNIEVIVRLQTRCSEPAPILGISQKEITKNANKTIDPNDVLFVVGEDNDTTCDKVGLIPATESDKSLSPTCLDLSSLRAMNGQTVPNTDVLTCLEPPPCVENLGDVSKQYKQIMEALTCKKKPPEPAPCCRPPKNDDCPTPSPPCCPPPPSDCGGGGGGGHRCPGLSEMDLMSSSSSGDNDQMPTCCCCSEEDAFGGNDVVTVCQTEGPPTLTESMVVKSRCCPICKEDLKWLPKLATCPKCGYKPVPECEERPYNDQITARDVIEDFMKPKMSCSEQSVPKKSQCTCTPTKTCAHCRIRKLCADVFRGSQGDPTDQCGKCEKKPSDEAYTICKTGGQDCRPFLSRVFSELKNLYDVREPEKKGLDQDNACELALNKESEADKHRKGKAGKSKKSAPKHTDRAVDDEERKDFLAKNFPKNNVCKSKNTYNYGSVRTYPGTKVGHKTCINGFAGRKNVPSNMGWLWNVEATGQREGWRPGAIRKPIKELMKYFLKSYPADTLQVSKYSYRKTKTPCEPEEDLVQKPTLHICKKNGEYFITMRPLKDTESLRTCADPYVNMKPIQFKIVKSPLRVEISKLKRCLKEMGFKKCSCHRPIAECYCRSFLDKKRLEYQVHKEACKRNLPPCIDSSMVLSDTSESETEFDFGVTPPAGVIKPERLKHPNMVNTFTQYSEEDWNVTPLYPKPPNKYMKLYNCAVGDRFGKAFGPYGAAGWSPAAAMGMAGPCGKGGKVGGKGGSLLPVRGVKGKPEPGEDPKSRQVDMMKYLMKSRGPKLSPAELAEKRRKRMRELAGVAPPLLCTVDRRGKPFDSTPMPCCYDPCSRDNRIC